jgi:hypothetical protein
MSGDPDNGSIEIVYLIDLEYRNGKEVVASPNDFRPVTLEPGQQTKVAFWEGFAYEGQIPEQYARVTFVFNVSKKLASKHGWWSGEVRKQVNFLGNGGTSNEPAQPTKGEAPRG